MLQLHRSKNIWVHVKHRFTQLSRDDRGSTILFVLSLISVLVLLGGAITHRTIFELRDVNRTLQRTQAFYLAEAGIQRALYEQGAGGFGATLNTGSYSVQVTNWGSDGVDNDNDATIDEADEANYYGVTSTGTAGEITQEVHSVMTGQVATQELFYHHAIYAGNTSQNSYTMEFGGNGSAADDVDGDIYINGNIDVDGDAVVGSPENYSDDNGNGEWDAGESFTDSNSNGYYDFGTEATGGISGVVGLTGGSAEISPPQLWSMNYQTLAEVDVAQEFDDYYTTAGTMVELTNSGIESWANPGSMYSKVWTVPESNPAHIFATHVLTDYGPVDDVVAPDNENFFLGDWHETSDWWYRNGEKITVNSNDNNKLYFVDGNLWIETNGYGPKLYSQTNGTRLTIVVKGNIYIADKLLYQNKSLDGLALLAMNDGETYTDRGNGQHDEGELYEDLNDNGSWNAGEPYNDTPDWQYTPGVDELHDYGLDGVPNTGDTGEGNGVYEGNSENSGNIFLGDPNVGPIGEIDAFLYAQNDFVDYVLNDNNRNPEDFEVYGTMAAGNHIGINRDRQINVTVKPWRRRWKGKTITYSVTQHTKMTVEFDDRLRTGTLELPHLPKGQNRVLEVGGGWGLLSWY